LVPTLVKRRGPFQLIYVDPPFNAGGQRKARRLKGSRATGEDAYIDAWGGLDAFLNMLGPRLEVFRSALSEDGSLWVHLDHRAVHDTKILLDGVFGRDCFAGEVIWVPGNGGRRRNAPSVTHQTLLIYRRGKAMVWNTRAAELREPYAETSRRMHFRQKGQDGRLYRERVINGKAYRYYADQGRLLGSVWTDCPAMTANTPLTRETTGYPTQKPETLLRRIIAGATKEGASVLDPMCGSGTTLAAALSLGRRATGCDQSALACEIAKGRIRKSKQRRDNAYSHHGRRCPRARRATCGAMAFGDGYI
jgi:site-specific DNA-methyltransferase (adenine-specific)